jgi:enamine deaminase RidA (YjgF/YER057c/UK114 family)
LPYNRRGAGVVRRAGKAGLGNVDAIASEVGTSLKMAVRVGVFLASEESFEEVDAVSRSCFEEPFPARTTVTVGLRGFAIEVDAVIALD